MHTVRGAVHARPWVLIARCRWIPGSEIGARGDDLAIIVRFQTLAARREVWRVTVANAAEHGCILMHAAVYRGELDSRAGIGTPTNRRVIPQRWGVDQRSAGVQRRRMG